MSVAVFDGKTAPILQPDAPTRVYQEHYFARLWKKASHWGQRKLFLSLLQFIVLYVKPARQNRTVYLVYAGAANGRGTSLLAQMFPWIKFHLYDTNPFDPAYEKGFPNVTLFHEYFTDEKARDYAAMIKIDENGNETEIYFVSDIRRSSEDYESERIRNESPEMSSTEVKKKSREATEVSIHEDMEMQQNWVEIIQPHYAQLKMRLPYVYDTASEKEYMYLDGIVYFQAFVGRSSTETRLIVERGARRIAWDPLRYEQQLFQHNINRLEKKYYHPLTGKLEPLAPDELLNDYDSLLEGQIWKDYCDYTGVEFTPVQLMKLAYMLTQYLSERQTLAMVREAAEGIIAKPELVTSKLRRQARRIKQFSKENESTSVTRVTDTSSLPSRSKYSERDQPSSRSEETSRVVANYPLVALPASSSEMNLAPLGEFIFSPEKNTITVASSEATPQMPPTASETAFREQMSPDVQAAAHQQIIGLITMDE